MSAKSLCVAKVELLYELKTSAIAIGSLSQNDDCDPWSLVKCFNFGK